MEDNVWTVFLIIAPIFHGIAILSTCFRLYHRVQSRRLWWDDFWALLSLVVTIIVLTVFLAVPFDTLFKKSKRMINIGYWFTIIPYTCALWCARMSVAVTIVRLHNPGPMRRCAKGACIFFGLACISLIIQKFFSCGKFSVMSWRCPIARSTAYFELSTDITADLWLLGAPMYMLWRMKLSSRRHHRLIQAIFGCGVLVTVPSVVHSVYIIRKDVPAIAISAQFQVSTSLMVCNLLVVVTYLYRVFQRNDEEGSSSSKSATSPQPTCNATSPPTHSNNAPSEISTAPFSFTEIYSTTESNPVSSFRSELHTSSNVTQTRSP